mgnify:CR=1 FL=1
MIFITAVPIQVHLDPGVVAKTSDMLEVERLQAGGMKVKAWLATLLTAKIISYLPDSVEIPAAVNDSEPD